MPRHRNVLVQHLGSSYLKDPQRVSTLCESYGAKQASGGFYLPTDAPWLPVAVMPDMPRRTNGGKVRIAHAPTSRSLKSTDVILEAIGRLNVELDLIEGVTNRECMVRKARADILVDKLTYGYGVGAIERHGCWGSPSSRG